MKRERALKVVLIVVGVLLRRGFIRWRCVYCIHRSANTLM